MALNPQKMTQAVTHWFEYESAIGRADLFDESYMAFPLGNYLQVHGDGEVKPEKDHPILNEGFTGRGRRPAIDFVVSPARGDDLTWAIETKFVVPSRDFSQELFDDLLRLECLIEKFRSARCLLVVAGKGADVYTLLAGKTGQVGGGQKLQLLFPDVLSLDLANPAKVVLIEKSIDPQRGYWFDAKHDRMAGWPPSLSTTLVGASGRVASGSEDFVCLAWEVTAQVRTLVQITK